MPLGESVDFLSFVASPILALVMLLARPRAHWAVALGLSLGVASVAGCFWIYQAEPPSTVGSLLAFFLLPFFGLFLASRLALMFRRPWALLLLGPLFYVAGGFLASAVWVHMLIRPL